MREREINLASEHLKGLLGGWALKKIGDMSGFVIRQRVVTAERFIPSLLGSLGTRGVESIADLLRDFNLDQGTAVAYKPYYNKLDTPCFPRMMRVLFELMAAAWVMTALKPSANSKLAVFRDIIITRRQLVCALRRLGGGIQWSLYDGQPRGGGDSGDDVPLSGHVDPGRRDARCRV